MKPAYISYKVSRPKPQPGTNILLFLAKYFFAIYLSNIKSLTYGLYEHHYLKNCLTVVRILEILWHNVVYYGTKLLF